MTWEDLLSLSNANGLAIGKTEQVLLERYAAELTSWNSKINLISRKDEDHILDRHILHSLVLRMPAICDYDFNDKRVADLGTGGGMPGIPFNIVTPSANVTLIDSIQKKITACAAMIESLKLTGISAVCGRAEELAKREEYAGTFDVIISRAVAPLDELANWGRGLLKPAGTLISLKGGDLSQEIRRAEHLKFVANVEERPLKLTGFDGFLVEDKKIVIARMRP